LANVRLLMLGMVREVVGMIVVVVCEEEGWWWLGMGGNHCYNATFKRYYIQCFLQKWRTSAAAAVFKRRRRLLLTLTYRLLGVR
jgi:hypothetical protein